ncbi:MAG: peroxiredoxin-like family protein [Bacteroidota bacterium]
MNDLKTPSYQEGLEELRDNLTQMLPVDALNVFDADAEALQAKYHSVLKLNKGDEAPDFTLSNATNKTVNLHETLQNNRVVLTFYRGTWCPYCNLMLAQYQSILPEIQKAGAVLIAISPQTPDESLSIKEKNDLQFEVLSDNDNGVARLFTTVFKYGERPLDTMAELGFDFDSFYADDSRELPIPATFIIEKDGTISFARSEGGDYRNRIEPQEIVNALNYNLK